MPYSLLTWLLLSSSISLYSQTFIDSLRIETSDTLYFDFGSSEIRPRGDSLLNRMAAAWSEGKRIYLTAHTDSIGSFEANERLASQRSEAAKQRFSELGIGDSVLLVETFGERQPVSRDTSEAARQRNRRVTIDLYGPQQYRRTVGQITDENGNGVEATILFRGKWFRDSVTTNASGEFEAKLPLDEVLGMEVYAPGFMFTNELFKVSRQKELKLRQELETVEVGTIADIEDLFFIQGYAILSKKSDKTLPRVLRFMEVNKGLQVEIAGHVSFPRSPPLREGTFAYDLSERRAKMVYDYLIENGVSADRLRYQAYSNFEMRYPEAETEEERQENRRVEIRVIGNALSNN